MGCRISFRILFLDNIGKIVIILRIILIEITLRCITEREREERETFFLGFEH